MYDVKEIQATAQTIFEKYETRFGRREKDAFLEFCSSRFKGLGYAEDEISIHKSALGKNLVVGPIDADILVTAHYDTPAHNGYIALPFVRIFGQALSTLLGAVILLVIFFLSGVAGGVLYGIGVIPSLYLIHIVNYIVLALLVALVFLFKNKHNRNDNTSGVLGVLAVAALAAQNPGLKKKCAFVLFDNEEKMLWGSYAFAAHRRKTCPKKSGSPVINLDCIGDGDVLAVASPKKHEVWDKLAEHFREDGFETEKKHSMLIYMSDHANFSRGVMVSFARRSRLGPLYLPNVHTRRDTVCDLDLIERLGGSVCRFVEKIQEGENNG
ncbi:MAG: M28 family peptidase [Oscillospiraceae bacterium]|nr:M28 family peptidase [Oscillospiraceae bacterium]